MLKVGLIIGRNKNVLEIVEKEHSESFDVSRNPLNIIINKYVIYVTVILSILYLKLFFSVIIRMNSGIQCQRHPADRRDRPLW